MENRNQNQKQNQKQNQQNQQQSQQQNQEREPPLSSKKPPSPFGFGGNVILLIP